LAIAHFHRPENKAVQWLPLLSEASRNRQQVNPEFCGILFRRLLVMHGIAVQHEPSLKCSSRRPPGFRVIGAMRTNLAEATFFKSIGFSRSNEGSGKLRARFINPTQSLNLNNRNIMKSMRDIVVIEMGNICAIQIRIIRGIEMKDFDQDKREIF
jgi:hypothetical protein